MSFPQTHRAGRVQQPQSGANPIHTVWPDLENDFGGDLLRQHYAPHPRPHRH